MNTRTKTTNVNMTPDIQAYLDKSLEKISRILGDDPAVHCDIELARTTAHHQKGDVFCAEMHLSGGGVDAYSSAEQADLLSAIQEARDELLARLRSTKEKRVSYLRRSSAKVKAMMKGLWPWGKAR